MEMTTIFTNKQNARLFYIDFLKILAAFAVVSIHVLGYSDWYSADVNSFYFKVFCFYKSISRWAVPVFIMASGALLLNKEIKLKDIFLKYILRVIIVFAVWSLIFAIYGLCHGKTFMASIKNFFIGHYHLWYLIMMIGLYLAIPFLKELIKHEKLTDYFLVLFLVFTLIIPFFVKIISFKNDFFTEIINVWVNNISNTFFIGYVGYFLLGYWIDKHTISLKLEIIIYILGVICFFLTIAITLKLSLSAQKANELFYNNLYFNIAFEGISIFVLFRKRFTIQPDGRLKSILTRCSKATFGIYLIHPMLLEIMNIDLGLSFLTAYSIITVPTTALIVFLISFIISLLLNCIPFVRNYFL